ncbi:DUF6035 family protein [Bradyrhizobium sp. 192]|uniref:DUF6035 family protein n=1 Tax=Bradyrhizobium sp. 192 TaxID=2782660 RepID=UPI001FFFDB2E|nr:DUF6035 family protein [Bradyrhizobium sp. 192]
MPSMLRAKAGPASLTGNTTPGAPQLCPWWTGTPASVDIVSAQQFDGAQESPLHAKIKHIVGELLTNDPRTTAGGVVVDEYLILENGRRRPDVRAIYDRMPLVVEVQLATTQIPIIVQREDFYESASIRLIWLTWNLEPPTSGRLLSSFEDICTPTTRTCSQLTMKR